MFNSDIYSNRRDILRNKLGSGVILLLGNELSPMNYPSNCYPFIQDSSFLYYTGVDMPDMVAIFDIDNNTDTLFGDDPTIDTIIWSGKSPSLEQIASLAGMDNYLPIKMLDATVKHYINAGVKIHFLSPYRPAASLLLASLFSISPIVVHSYSSTILARAIIDMREIKSELEIEEISKACDIGYLMHTKAMQLCREGVTERRVAAGIEGVALTHGKGVSFHNIVSQQGQILHNHSHNSILQNGSLLLIDAGALSLSGYCSDFTRTLPVSGKFTPLQADIYNIVVAASDRALMLIRPGIPYKDVHFEVCKTIAQGLVDLGFMKGDITDIVLSGAHALFMPHGLGHQLGMDVHDMEGLGESYVGYNEESSRSDQFGLKYLRMGKKLVNGHVMTVEPGIYFIEELYKKFRQEQIAKQFMNYSKIDSIMGFGGIRVEDNVVVTNEGVRLLGSKRIPHTVKGVEDYMAKFKG